MISIMADYFYSVDSALCSKIAQKCIQKFDSLGKSGKPGKNEWNVLACIVQVQRQKPNDHKVEVVALGTGSKCLGKSKLPLNGDRLHDSHAEIIAQRAFKLYLLQQLIDTMNGKDSIFTVEENGFSLQDGITFHFYSSSVPCGDASIFPKSSQENPLIDSCVGPSSIDVHRNFMDVTERDAEGEPLTKKKKIVNGNDIHRTGAKCVPCEHIDPKESGINYHTVGVLRTKPGRGDPTLSHCCSDKMLKWTILGVQGGLLMLFLAYPIYLKTVVIGNGPFSMDAMQRALHNRFLLELHSIKLNQPFAAETPAIMMSDEPFKYSKLKVEQNSSDKSLIKPSPASIIWSLSTVHFSKSEVSVEGKRLGSSKKNESSPKCRVSICRIELLRKVFELIDLVKDEEHCDKFPLKFVNKFSDVTRTLSYEDLKSASVNYSSTWETLKKFVFQHWVPKPKFVKNFSID